MLRGRAQVLRAFCVVDEDCHRVLLCEPGLEWKTRGRFVRCVSRARVNRSLSRRF